MKSERTTLLWVIIVLLAALLIVATVILAMQKSKAQLNKNAIEQALKSQQNLPTPK
jgi:flagellar basal body-associated protein FliL